MGVGNAALQQIVQTIDAFPSGLHVQAALHNLDAKMVFFVDHHAELFAGVDCNCPRTIGFGQFATDQLTLNQKLAIDFRQFVNVNVSHFGPVFELIHPRSNGSLNAQAVFIAASPNERKISEVASQSNTAADDDIGFRTGTAQPLATLCR